MAVARLRCVSLLLAGLVAAPLMAAAQDAPTEVVFGTDGGARLEGTLSGAAATLYRFDLDAGVGFAILLDAGPSANFDLLAPDEPEPLHDGALDGVRFAGEASTAGGYTVRVYLDGQAAADGRIVPYVLAISRDVAAAPDFAGYLSGGPDFLEVANLTTRLNLRAEPSLTAPVLRTARLGTQLRNHGCREAEGRRWCQVEARDGTRAWAAGEFLRESAGDRF